MVKLVNISSSYFFWKLQDTTWKNPIVRRYPTSQNPLSDDFLAQVTLRATMRVESKIGMNSP
ncbi:hypothetical protein H6G41_06430 [Tolypothrix sp. FACHB-123]|uniref:hypothetical protein n=1 Tax=Tolypothrix sp. FACHB-123 TaxID=2692868 RepID=UPI0016832A7F|nr:hypothetical protein [Tolypothrix sp. FACHB-123]MBD2354266.1 hypothetical protein [Tolypothrix sp. FACHB-123]